MHKVLVLGAGRVAAPLVKYLLNHSISVTLADADYQHALMMLEGHPLGNPIRFDVTDEVMLNSLVGSHDLVVSLLPFAFHPLVAKACLKNLRNLVTTSYVKPEMENLDAVARQAGVLLLNEMGLDPGIDHMSAMRIIHQVESEGGTITAFNSFCGALPAPEAANNPFGYKFSWSPKGVLLAGNSDARFLSDGHEVIITAEDLFKNPLKVDFPDVGSLEVYPNRDSISYINVYGLKDVQSMMRGTFRYPGWCESIDAMKRLNLFSDLKVDFSGLSFAEMTAQVASLPAKGQCSMLLSEKLRVPENSSVIKALDWLGLFDSLPVGRGIDSPFEVVSDLMLERMELLPHERDMVVIQHFFDAVYPDGQRKIITSRLLDFGIPDGDTSIARTVALPAAIAVRLILEGKIPLKGVHRPVCAELYNPVLDELVTLGIAFREDYQNIV